MGHQKLTEDEGFALVQAWQESGQRQSAYCRERDIAIHLLQYWRKRFSEQRLEHAISITPVVRADAVGSVFFSRSADGGMQLSVCGDFDVSTCRVALALLP